PDGNICGLWEWLPRWAPRLQCAGEPRDPLAGRRPASPVPGPGTRPRPARGPAGGGGRPVAHPRAQRLPPGHLSLVLGRPADPVVVAGPAHGVRYRRRAPVLALPPHATHLAVGGARGY